MTTLIHAFLNENIDKILECIEEEAYNQKVQLMEDRLRFIRENSSHYFRLPFSI